MTEIRRPKQAATVILLRSAEAKGFEVFLTRRPDGMPSLGGMYCYPGGTVTKDDITPRMVDRSRGLTPKQARNILGANYSPSEAIGLWITGVREVFEEVGVLLAAEQFGAQLIIDDNRAAHLEQKHAALLKKSMSFLELLESESLVCDLAALSHFSYWQTPSQVRLRFATHFFIAPLPEGQTPLATSNEVTHSLWLTPDRAMQLFNRGDLPMIFPTFAALRTLADFETLESVLSEFGLRE
jgi:8-oxo-dGTP pyrophosphatase MutT (NUDIX family)